MSQSDAERKMMNGGARNERLMVLAAIIFYGGQLAFALALAFGLFT